MREEKEGGGMKRRMEERWRREGQKGEIEESRCFSRVACTVIKTKKNKNGASLEEVNVKFTFSLARI